MSALVARRPAGSAEEGESERDRLLSPIRRRISAKLGRWFDPAAAGSRFATVPRRWVRPLSARPPLTVGSLVWRGAVARAWFGAAPSAASRPVDAPLLSTIRAVVDESRSAERIAGPESLCPAEDSLLWAKSLRSGEGAVNVRRTVAEEVLCDALVRGDERRVRGTLAGARDTRAGAVDGELGERVIERVGGRLYERLDERVIERLGETAPDSTRLGLRVALRVTRLDAPLYPLDLDGTDRGADCDVDECPRG